MGPVPGQRSGNNTPVSWPAQQETHILIYW